MAKLASQPEKVELSLASDMEKEFKKIQSATELIAREGKQTSKEQFDLTSRFIDIYNSYNATAYIVLLQKYTTAAKDLGVDIDSKYDKAIEDYQQTKKTFNSVAQRG